MRNHHRGRIGVKGDGDGSAGGNERVRDDGSHVTCGCGGDGDGKGRAGSLGGLGGGLFPIAIANLS